MQNETNYPHTNPTIFAKKTKYTLCLMLSLILCLTTSIPNLAYGDPNEGNESPMVRSEAEDSDSDTEISPIIEGQNESAQGAYSEEVMPTPSETIEPMAAFVHSPSSKDSQAYQLFVHQATTYYLSPSTSSTVVGSWNRGTIVGGLHYDDTGLWFYATMGDMFIYFQSNGVDKLASGDSTNHAAYTAKTTGKKDYYLHPSEKADAVGSWNVGTEIGCIHFNKEGTWLRATMGEVSIYFTANDLDFSIPHDSTDKSAYMLLALKDTSYYASTSTSPSQKLGTWSAGTVLGGMHHDAAGLWYYAYMGTQIVYFKANTLELLPAKDSADTKAYSAHTTKMKKYYSAPSVNASVKGTWNAGQNLGYIHYDNQNKWFFALMGAQTVYFTSDDLIQKDSTDTRAYSLLALSKIPYFSAPLDSSNVLGSFNKGTMLGGIHYDNANHWYYASMGPQTIYFKSIDLEVLPTKDVTTHNAQTATTTAKKTYYSAPSKNAVILGSWSKNTTIGCVRYDVTKNWYSAYMGSMGTVYFTSDDLIVSVNKDSTDTRAYSLLALDTITYYSSTSVASQKIGVWEKGSVIGGIHYDAEGEWFYASMGALGTVYFPARNLEVLPSKNSSDLKAYSGYTHSDKNYYSAPSTNATIVGTFPKNTILGCVHYDAGGKWFYASMGNKTVYFTSDNMQVAAANSVFYNISLDAMVLLQMTKGTPKYSNGSSAPQSAVKSALDPNSFPIGSASYYQFTILSSGYSGLTAAQLDGFIASTSSGRSGNLYGCGTYFVSAAQQYGINESYLLAHAILESGWGTSTLAKGYYYDGNTAINGKYYPAGTYYNFYGIGAYDTSPLSGGRAMAISQGWNSPEKAISGAAYWISTNYVNKSGFKQNTLYKMRWDINNAMLTQTPWHQYATDIAWPASIAGIMSQVYSRVGYYPSLNYEVPAYL